MTLPELLSSVKERAALPAAHEHSSPTVYAGHEFENTRLHPIITGLLAIIEADQAALAQIASADWRHKEMARDAQSAALAKLQELVGE